MQTVVNKEGSVFVLPLYGLSKGKTYCPQCNMWSCFSFLLFFSDSRSDCGQLWKQRGRLTWGGTHVSNGPRVTLRWGHFRNVLPLMNNMVKAIFDEASFPDWPVPSGRSYPCCTCPRSGPPWYKVLWRLAGSPCNQTFWHSPDSTLVAPKDLISSSRSCAHGLVHAHVRGC